YLNGALILVENQFSKGDVVRIAGVSGTVEDFSLRRTTLRDLDGVVHTVPNGEITVASNLTRVWSRINQDVTVAYGTDIDAAIKVVDAVGAAMAADPQWKRRILEAPKVDRVAALGEYGVTIKILGTVRAPDQWSAAGELRKRLLAAFHEHGIEIPRPQRVVLASQPGGPPSDLEPTVDPTAAGPSDVDLTGG
ncbi:MAG TPA: mechanosensitive ion channel domain-containing protein, partial [Candidatus Binatus sp.]|nr:mechanosensitive ion channel domain-containing protein [Candidatus Binatus sp.]